MLIAPSTLNCEESNLLTARGWDQLQTEQEQYKGNRARSEQGPCAIRIP